MTDPATMREYYRRLVSAGRRGDPTIDEARADYCRVVDAQLPALLFRILESISNVLVWMFCHRRAL